MDNYLKTLYFTLPFILWPLTFIVFKPYFMISMFFSTLLLSGVTLYFFREHIDWGEPSKSLISGIISAITLYLIFYTGNYIAGIIGLGNYVAEVYKMIRTVKNIYTLLIGLALIGLFEEIYWRGGLQGEFKDSYAWIKSTIPYTIVHISTLNPILVVAALIVGLILGLTAQYFGLTASIISHITWLELIIVIIPPT